MNQGKYGNQVLTVRCIHKHSDGLTKGNNYKVVDESEKYYDINPDDFGHLSSFDKRYFKKIDDKKLIDLFIIFNNKVFYTRFTHQSF